MKLFGALSCILVSALAVFAIVTNHATGLFLFSSKINAESASTGATTIGEPADVIVINEKTPNHVSHFGGAGWSTTNGPRELAEKKFRQNNFAGAIELYKKVLKDDPSDIRSQLDLGRSYAALHKYDDAITFLSKVRNECSRVNARTNSSGPEMESSNLDFLPDQACESIDHEARLVLENAVLATIKPANPKSASLGSFKNDRHFQVLNASLQLAKRYHVKLRLDELTAMYQLAANNTRTLPADLITACSTNAKGAKNQWHELTRLLVNSKVEEERNWYLDRIAIVSNGLSDADIEKAATYHILVKNDFDAFQFQQFATADAIRKEIKSHSPKFALLYANAVSDCGLRFFNNRYRNQEAKEFFQLAMEIYSKSGTEKDVDDTNYNLGMVSFALNEVEAAKAYFKRAARSLSTKDQLVAAFRETIHALFPDILRKTNRANELPEFFQREQKRLGYSQSLTSDITNKDTIRQALQDNWFCPPHTSEQLIVVHVRIDENGYLKPTSIDMTSADDSGVIGSILDESLRWTTFDKPPAECVGKELTLVFNASNGIAPQPILGSSLYPDKVAPGEW